MQSIFFRHPADSQPAGRIEGGILSVSTIGYASLYNQIIQMHKRTTSKIFARARELRREMTPVERKLWARLRAHRMQDVHFRTQHAIGNYVVDFCSVRKRLIIELDGTPFGRSMLNKKTMTRKERSFWNQKDTACCGFGITM